MNQQQLEQLCVNTIRTLSIDGVQKANSGHPGMPMGMADVAFVLWTRFLKHNPVNPKWVNRDRFILSAGHGSMLLYSLLYLTGYGVRLDDLKQFRQWGSITPGHPEYGMTPGVEMTTGPLGQGFATGVGMALAERYLSAQFNKNGLNLVDHFTYAIVGDGDLMEGVSAEAASFAGHQKLGKLIYLYDDNHISIDGNTDLAFTEDSMTRFEAYGWHVQRIDGHDRKAIENAILKAQEETQKPSIIACRTHIGYGSPHKQDTAGVHGSPLGPEEVKLTKQAYEWPYDEPFTVPESVLTYFRKALEVGQASEQDWHDKVERARKDDPTLVANFENFIQKKFDIDWDSILPLFKADEKGMATRAASGKVINALASVIPNIIGGSADLAPSNNTYLKDYPDCSPEHPDGRNIHFGVREHAMGAILNGMALHSGFIPYGGTFLIFSDYMRPAIRLSALMEQQVVYVFTHDSIGLGEDGPTHQPIEQLASLRLIPNTLVLRPCDANETALAWKLALQHKTGPVILALSRQALPTLNTEELGISEENVRKGGYILQQFGEGQPDLILMASGSEVSLALSVARQIARESLVVRVVSMISMELFLQQNEAYKQSVLPAEIKAKVALEAGRGVSWSPFVGEHGRIISIEKFGASAPADELFKHYGFTVENVIRICNEIIS